MATYRLNVIFHGPFIFVFYKDRVEVLCADIEEHDFGMGNWTEERPCDAGTYYLKGIQEQKNRMLPHPATHVIINAKALPYLKIAQDTYYRFVLPVPSLMQALGLLKPIAILGPKSPFIIDDTQKKHVNLPARIGSAHVLSYEINQDDKPRFYNFPWVPKLTPNGKLLPVTNVHIFSESPFVLDELHPNRDFNLLKNMLAGLFLDIVEPFPKVSFKLEPAASKLGICDIEQGGLRGLPPKDPHFLIPPRICDAPSLVVNAS